QTCALPISGQDSPLWLGERGIGTVQLGAIRFPATACAQKQGHRQGGHCARMFHASSPARRLVSPIAVATQASKVTMTDRIRPAGMVAQASLACSKALMSPKIQVTSRSRK